MGHNQYRLILFPIPYDSLQGRGDTFPEGQVLGMGVRGCARISQRNGPGRYARIVARKLPETRLNANRQVEVRGRNRGRFVGPLQIAGYNPVNVLVVLEEVSQAVRLQPAQRAERGIGAGAIAVSLPT